MVDLHSPRNNFHGSYNTEDDTNEQRIIAEFRILDIKELSEEAKTPTKYGRQE